MNRGQTAMELQQALEKSARKVFKIFFGSRIYKKTLPMSGDRDVLGVDMLVECEGPKRMSLFMERDTVRHVMGRLTDNNDAKNDQMAYDIISEMANIIAGTALSSCQHHGGLSVPVRSAHRHAGGSKLSFAARMGCFSIYLADL